MTIPRVSPTPPNAPASGSRAAIYLRESALEATRPDRYGIPVQRDQCTAYCDENGYTVVDEYLDKVADSEELDRPEMNRLRRDIRAGGLDVVVIARYDRLARDPGLQNFLLYEAEKVYGVAVAFADPDEQYDDSPYGLLMRTVKGIANQQARQDIRKKTQAARRKRASEGKLIPGRKAPFGYIWRDAKKTALDPDPATAPVVRRLYADLVAGISLWKLAQTLNDEGVPIPTGKPDGRWRPSGITRILRRTTYIGEYESYHCQYEKRRRLRRDGTVAITKVLRERAADDPARIRVPDGVVPPIVDREVWLAVQRILDSNRAASPRHNRDPEATLLRGGLVSCGHCGRPMHAHRRKPDKRNKTPDLPDSWQYVCDRTSTGSPCPSNHQNIAAHRLDSAVWRLFSAYLLNTGWLRNVYDALAAQAEKQQVDGDSHALNLASHARDLDEQVTRLSDRIGRENDDAVADVLSARLKQVLDERKKLRTLQDEAEQRYIERRARLNRRMDFLDFAQQAHDVLLASDASYALKRGLLDAFEIRVIVWHATRKPRWMFVLGFQTLLDDMLAGEVTDFNIFLPDGGAADHDVVQAALADMQPVVSRELAWRLTPSGRKGGQPNLAEVAQNGGYLSDTLTPIADPSSGRCGSRLG